MYEFTVKPSYGRGHADENALIVILLIYVYILLYVAIWKCFNPLDANQNQL